MKKLIATLFVTAAALAPAAAADYSKEWPHYAQDDGGNRYSPLTQITPQNVAKLQKVWTFHMRPASLDVLPQSAAAGRGGVKPSPPRFLGSEATPLVVNGVMFVDTPYGRVVALNALTGAEIWAYDLPGNDRPAQRGVE